jgi:ubiquinone/menaquinone biosynthesis C-methylase UbiE
MRPEEWHMPGHTESRREAWDRSATDYAAFSSHSRLYRETAAALVRLAGIEAGMTVVDLACGTGMVTASILERCGGDTVTIIATDFSAQMIAQARQRIASPRVTFHCEAAERLSQVVEGPVDRVLCNAAFWQFDREPALAEIARVLEPSGKCLLTLPDWSVFADELDVQYEKHKLLWMIREEMFIRGHRTLRLAPRAPVAGPTAPAAADAFRFSNESLQVETIEPVAVTVTAQDFFEFLHIPVMIAGFSKTCGVPDDELRDILAVVRNQLEWVTVSVPPQPWRVVVLKKVRNRSIAHRR